MRTLTILIASSVAVACCAPAPVTIQADISAVCEAQRPDMPIRYHGGRDGLGGHDGEDTVDTIKKIKRANARFRAACD